MDAETLISRMSSKVDEPSKQLLSVFDVLHETIQKGSQVAPDKIFNYTLNKHCVKLSQQARANHPKILADHLLFIAENAFLQEAAHPESKSLIHAKKVAQALIQAQTHTPNFLQPVTQRPKLLAGGLISFCALLVAGWLFFTSSAKMTPETSVSIETADNSKTTRSLQDSLTAQEASAMYTKFEMMRNGTCRYIEAIQIPDQDKAVYLESVVGGKLPTNLKDLATANAYLEKIDCNYTPMLMQKSK